jgi:hypothetical protein
MKVIDWSLVTGCWIIDARCVLRGSCFALRVAAAATPRQGVTETDHLISVSCPLLSVV